MTFVRTIEAVGTKTPLHTERLNNFKSEFYVNIVEWRKMRPCGIFYRFHFDTGTRVINSWTAVE